MSSLFNQTNIAPGTAFATGGGSGGSNFPSGITIGTCDITPIDDQAIKVINELRVGGPGFGNTILDAYTLSFQDGATGTTYPAMTYGLLTNKLINLSNTGTVNGSAPLLFRTGNTPTPINVIVQGDSASFVGNGSTDITLPIAYSNYMLIQLTQTSKDSTPDGVMYYNSSNLSAFSVFNTGSNTNIQFDWIAMGW